MTAWVSLRGQPTSVHAALFSLVIHMGVLLGLNQYNMHPHQDVKLGHPHMQPVMDVMFLTEPFGAFREQVTPSVSDFVAPVSVEPQPQMTASTAVQIKMPTPRRKVHTQTQSDQSTPNISSPSIVGTGQQASTGQQSRDDGHASSVGTLNAEGQQDLRPTQLAHPDYSYNPKPDYPILLREQGVGGVVWLRVWVDSAGRPVEIKLAKGSGYRLLDDAALRSVKSWRFIPAKHGEQRLASWVEFPIRFTLND